MSDAQHKIAVIGLGYVGLPLALALDARHQIIGYDHNPERVKELQAGLDRTGLYDEEARLPTNAITFTSDPSDLAPANRYIIAVPSPIDDEGRPDLSYLNEAIQTVAGHLRAGDLVTLESTVYPGFTEEHCQPLLDSISGMTAGEDYHLAYSPERINPGDASHIITNTVKLVGGLTFLCRALAAELYEPIVHAGLHLTSSIRVAEAAKSLENVQRDVNIALMNECALIYHQLGINTHEVLAAAGTKWNFNRYEPGLVGGHCIGVDSSYLTYRAQKAGYDPKVILSGRRVNDFISVHLSQLTLDALNDQSVSHAQARVLVMGVTFKENVRDIRNSKVFDLIDHLQRHGIHVDATDPHALSPEVKRHYDMTLLDEITDRYHAVILAVKHQDYMTWDTAAFHKILVPGGHLIDVKGVLKDITEIPVHSL